MKLFSFSCLIKIDGCCVEKLVSIIYLPIYNKANNLLNIHYKSKSVD